MRGFHGTVTWCGDADLAVYFGGDENEDWCEDKYEYEDGHRDGHGHDMSMEQMKEARE